MRWKFSGRRRSGPVGIRTPTRHRIPNFPNPSEERGVVIRYIDSHIHLDHVFTDHPERIRWLGSAGCTPVSWSFCRRVDDVPALMACLENHQNIIRRAASEGLSCYFLAGVHPRNISPDLKPGQIRDLVLPYLEDPLCLGIGEIGLETGDSRETEIFLAHLALAGEVRDRNKVFGIHTPRENKAAVTKSILDLLEPYRVYGERIVIDHCRPDTIAGVLSAGFRAGVTLSPVKASSRDVADIIATQKDWLSRMMLNTDSGGEFYEDLDAFVRSEQPDETVKASLVRENAARFFGIPAGRE